jgi:hypothetical protein
MFCTVPGCDRPVEGKFAKFCPQCRSLRRRKRVIWKRTPQIEALIREAWTDPVLHGKAACQWVAEKIGWPKWAVKRCALELGLSKCKRAPAWTVKEIEIVKKFAWMHPQSIRQKLMMYCGTRRSQAAIMLKRNRIGITYAELDGGYTAQALSGLLGIDVHKVSRWIRAGLLKAERRKEQVGSLHLLAKSNHNPYWIPKAEVRRFIINYPAEIDIHKVDKFWFIEVLSPQTELIKRQRNRRDEDELALPPPFLRRAEPDGAERG